MPQSDLRFVKRYAEYLPKSEVAGFPKRIRGIYVLYVKDTKKGMESFDVVYVGLATSGIGGRLRAHRRSKRKLWTHFSAYEVWENVRDDEIEELEGLFRHVYRKDRRANVFNLQRSFKRMKKIKVNNLRRWRRFTFVR